MKNFKGFTIIELIVVLLIISTLALIAAPTWLAFVSKQRQLDTAYKIKDILHSTSHVSKQKRIQHFIKFRESNNLVEYSVSSSSSDNWKTLNISSEITLDFPTYISTDYRGYFYPIFVGKKFIIKSNHSSEKVCVEIRTLLGSTAIDKGVNCD